MKRSLKNYGKAVAVTLAVALCMTGVLPVTVTSGKTQTTSMKTTSTKKKSKKIALNQKKVTVAVSGNIQLKLKNAKAKKVKWSSSNKKVATVTKKGVVRALKKGTATITAKYQKKRYKATIKVKKALQVTTNDINGSTLRQAIYLTDEMYEGKNIVVSPVSLNLALGMVANGAKDAAKKDCEAYLGADTDKYNAQVLKLMNRAKADKVLSLANGVWYKNGYTVNDNFYQQVTKNYLAEVQPAAMDQSTVEEINQWASDHTDGMIKKVLDEISRDTVAILSNALLFDGKWTNEFEPYATDRENFTDGNGTKQKVDMMHSEESVYYENDYAVGFEKTYGKKKEYSFIGILPKTEGDFALGNLDIENLLKTKTTKYKVYLSMPKFTYDWKDTDGKHTLTNVLKQTKLASLFDKLGNPMGNLLNTTESVFVSDVMQACKIIVDEDGTKAAAVTTIIMEVKSARVSTQPTKTVKLNRPFGYMIKDNQTGEVLFMGKVTEITQ